MEILRGAPARVARRLLDGGPATASALAEDLELTSAAVRRHLEDLLSAGLVEGTERPPFGPDRRAGGRGRPAKYYSITPAGRNQFDQAYDSLAEGVMRFLLARLGPEGVSSFARERAQQFSLRYSADIQASDDPVETLAASLSADGYAASLVPAGNGWQLCQHNCPILHVAATFPALCEAETEMLAELLGTHVTRLATLAHGDGVCTTLIPRPAVRGRRAAPRTVTIADNHPAELLPAGSREGRP
ncbi:MAG: helix-turn-helix transcriptional regulator [Candidatus Nanopelagicales bacterium]